CLGLGGACTPGSGSSCCNGTSCLPTRNAGYACQSSGAPDGGGTCGGNGSACDAGGGCCSQICSSGTCHAPAACQPLSGACTPTSDCCSGLACNVPSGNTTGTCQPAS